MFFRRRASRARPRRLSWDRIDKLFEMQLQLLELEDRTAPATFTVTTNADFGAGSFRQAILDANAAIGADTIDFNIGVGTQTIQPVSALPSITDSVTIDATTQPGFAGSPIIELDGSNAGASVNGLVLLANDSVVQGFVINGFSAAGIQIFGASATGNTVRLNYIGTNLSGTAADPNVTGILIDGGANANTVGGVSAGSGNVVSGNSQNGIFLTGAGTEGNVVAGNYVGTNAAGTAALGNAQQGIYLTNAANNNIVGAYTATPGTAGGNVVSANGFSGIGTLASSNTLVIGNISGLNAAGTAILGNTFNGVFFGAGGTGNVLGGTVAGARNVISGNASGGTQGAVSIFNGTSNTVVQGNYIGTDITGTLDLGNLGSGVEVLGGLNNTIGGTTAAARNVISGNSLAGVSIKNADNFFGFTGPSSGNVVLGNYLGTTAAGTAALGNSGDGVLIQLAATNNTIGGSAAGAGNVIGGNSNAGVTITGTGTTGNLVLGNFIGTNAAGTAKLTNGTDGVAINSGAAFNTIGGIAATPGTGPGNVISGNSSDGIQIFGANNNLVQGNLIGLNAAGTAAIINGTPATGSGIYVPQGSNNTIGGSVAGAGNVVSGSFYWGIHLEGANTLNTHDNVIAGNRIGTNAAGTAAVANGSGGILISAKGFNNTIGGSTAGAGNLISGNTGTGVTMTGAGTTGNALAGNFIGTNAAGTAALANTSFGITVSSGASLNNIGTNGDGSNDAAERNVVSGNGNIGINIINVGSDANVVAGNYVGVNAAGTGMLRNNGTGVYLGGGARNNRIGTDANGVGDVAERNVISGNLNNGISIKDNGTISNFIAGNFIGTNAAGLAAVANGGRGIELSTSAGFNRIGTNGDNVNDAAERNVISGNGDHGIMLSGANASGVIVAGNIIGLGADGATQVANGVCGVLINGGANANRIGTNGNGVGDALERNIISGNNWQGVEINGSGTNNNIVAGNYIGLNEAGTVAARNAQFGIWIGNGAGTNRVGTDGNGVADLAERNVISGNTQGGIAVTGSGTINNKISGNYIGLNVAGDAKIANGNDGVLINNNASTNTVGGTTAAAGNVISGNTRYGVLINGTTSNSNIILGNRVGTNAAGTAALMNEVGIRLEGSADTVIGGGVAGAGNLVSGNRLWGIELLDSVRAVVAGNLVGLNAAGNAAIPNIHGIIVNVNAADSRVGTNADGVNDAGERNVFAGNSGNNVLVQLAAKRSVIAGNYIGTDPTGTVGIFGTGAALVVAAGATDTRIGTNGDGVNDATEANIIAAGLYEGILIDGDSTDRTVIAGNRIGIGAAGIAIPNGTAIHVRFGPADTRIGTAGDGVGDAAERNVISGNTGWGIIVQTPQWNGTQPAAGVFTERTTIAGNFIGTNLDATAAMGNAGGGVLIQLGATQVRIGTDGNGVADEAERNIVSGNTGSGVDISGSGTTGVVVAGNYIGTNAAGTAAIRNGGTAGVFIQAGASNTRVGTDGNGVGDVAERNIISGNLTNGIFATGVGTDNNRIAGNFIGLNVDGSAAIPNAHRGIVIQSGSKNNIVGTNGDGAGDAAERNVISGNGLQGILVNGSGIGSDGNVIAGNYIGTNVAGDQALGNAFDGIWIGAGVTNNRVGTNADGVSDAIERNLISGNKRIGVILSTASSNVVAGNYIGTNASGSAALPNLAFGGVWIQTGATNNRIGSNADGVRDDVERNVISGNATDGVVLVEAATKGNTVAGNYIGTDATGTIDLGNAMNGVKIYVGAAGNTIGGTAPGARNVIGGNNANGVHISDSGTAGNVILGNYIGTDAGGFTAVANAGDGIRIEGGAAGNTIGGTAAGAGNVVSGNAGDGVVVSGAGVIAGGVSRFRADENANDSIGSNNATITGGTTFVPGVSGQAFNFDGTGYVRIPNNASLDVSALTVAGWIKPAFAGRPNLPFNFDTILQRINATGVGYGLLVAMDPTAPFHQAPPGGVPLGTPALSVRVGSGIYSLYSPVPLANDGQYHHVAGTFDGTTMRIFIDGVEVASRAVAGTIVNAPIDAFIGRNTSQGTLDLYSRAAIDDVVLANRALSSGEIGLLFAARGAGALGNRIQGNFIGTDATGTAALGNFTGVRIDGGASGNIVGGTTVADRNIISGNAGSGVRISGIGTNNNAVAGNSIGTDGGGDTAIGNQSYGIEFRDGALNNVFGAPIGSNDPNLANRVAHNATGIAIASDAGSGNVVRLNQLYANSVSNFTNALGSPVAPTIDLAVANFGVTRVAGSLVGMPGATVTLDFYEALPGETAARRLIGTAVVVLDGMGTANYDLRLPGNANPGNEIVVTASTAAAGTSEFGGPRTALAPINIGVLAPTLTPEGTEVTLSARVSSDRQNAVFTFEWAVVRVGSTGTVATGTDNSLNFTPTDDGVYRATLTVRDITNNEAVLFTAPDIVVTNASPFAAMVDRSTNQPIGDASISTGGVLRLRGKFTDPGISDTHSEAWFINGGTTPVATGPNFDFSTMTAGRYIVTYRVTDNGGAVGEYAVAVTVRGAISATISGLPSQSLEGVRLTAAALLDGLLNPTTLQYRWKVTKDGVDFGSLASTPTAQNSEFSFTPDDNANYVVSLTVTDPETGASATDSKSVAILNVAPTVRLNATGGTPALGQSVPFAAVATDPGTNATHDDKLNYAWSVVGPVGFKAPAGSGSGYSFLPTVAGIYFVTVTVNDKDGGRSGDSQMLEIVTGSRTVEVAGLPSGAVGEGTTLNLLATTSAPGVTFTYAWSAIRSGVELETGSNPTFDLSLRQQGIYTVLVTATGTDGSIGTAAHEIVALNAAPNAAIAPTPVSAPEGTTVNFVGIASDPAGSDDALKYRWSVTGPGLNIPNAGTEREFPFVIPNNVTYEVTLTVTDPSNLSATATRTIVGKNIAPSVTILNDGTTADRIAVKAVANEPGLVDVSTLSFQWFLDGSPVAGATGPSFASSAVGRISVEVSDGDETTAAVVEIFLATGTAPFVVPAPDPSTTQVLVIGDAGNNTIDARNLTIPAVLDGGDGDDTVYGGSGDDILFAGGGAANLLVGGEGDNRFYAGTGDDTMIGGTGDDTYYLTFSRDVVVDAGGYDTLDASTVAYGITLNLTLTGPQIVAGTSSLDLSGNFELLIGTSHDDRLYAGTGDEIDGGLGADSLFALAAGVTLYGGDGNDDDAFLAEPGAAQSLLIGGGGSDKFVALAPSITLYGGGGDDDFTLSGDAVGSVVQGGTGRDVATSAASNVTLYGGEGDDDFTVTNGTNVVVTGGDGTIGTGEPTLAANSGNDKLSVIQGNRITLYGGDGDDTAFVGGGTDIVANGNAGNDTLVGLGTGVSLSGDGGADTLVALAGSGITLYGGDDDDFIVAGGGTGTAIVGGDGNDKLVAANAGGRITLYGGDGDDEFAINPTTPTLVPDGEGGTVTLAPAFGTDIFADGGADNDFLTVSAGSAITLYGGDGDDFTLATGGTNIVLAGGGMNDIAVAASAGASVTLYGGEGDDTLIANPDQPIVLPTVRGPVAIPAASALAVTLYGGEGDDDLIVAGGSNVVASGNAGKNSFVVAGGTAITLYGGDQDDDFAVAAPGNAVPLPGGYTYPAAPISKVAIVGGSGQNQYAIAGGSAITLYGGDGDEDFAITGGENIAAVGAIGQDKMTVAGTASSVTLYGGDNDDDVLVAGGTDVQVDGNTGNDEVVVSGGKGVVVRGLEGRDRIATTGGLGVTLYGGDGDDELFATNFADAPVLVGGDGNDRLVANPDVAITLYGGDADEFVIQPQADASNVVLVGNQGTDRLIVQGGSGITLYGGDGDDGLILDSGSSIAVDGGTGKDTFVVRSAGGGITLFGGDGDDDFQIAGGSELVVHGNDGNDSIAVAGGNGWFYGDAGSDRLAAGRSTAVTLFGGSGDERIVAAGGAVAANLYGGDGDDELVAVSGSSNVLVGNDGKDRLVAIATDNVTLYGLAGDDVFEILGGTNITALGDLGIYGYTGADTFTVSGGTNVNVYGERSNDIIAINGGTGVSAFGGSGNDLLSATGGTNILLAGNADNDLIQGNSIAGVLAFGGTGDDILATGGKGADILVGEEGNDRYQFSNPVGDVVLTLDEVRRLGDDEPFRDSYGHGSDVLDLRFLGSGVTLDLSRVAGKVATAADRQTILAGLNLVLFGVFDQVWGTPHADRIVGNDANNTFLGFGGNDTLVGGAGNDTLVGGDGNNSLEGDDGSDVFRFQYATALSAGTDAISDNAADTDTLDFAPLTPANGPSFIATGLSIDLGLGSVQTVGGGRNFVIVGGTGIEGATGTNFSDTLVGTAGNDWLVGGGGNDSLVGGLGSDTLSGGGGDNTLSGGDGDDWYELAPAGIDRIVDTGGYDTADFSQADRSVTFTLLLDGGQLQTVDEAGNHVSISGTLERLMGSSFDDILTGNAVANEIIGRNGLDILNGAGGDDFVEGGYTQVVLLDFDSETRPGEYVYSATMRAALLDRFNALFAPFGIQFVASAATAQAESARYGGRYTVLRFNSGAPGGVSSEIDPRNVNLGGLTQVNAYDYLAKYLPDHLAPSLVDGAMLELSFAIGAHELGHLFGLRHADAFGPIGSGIYVGGSLTPESFRPPSDAGWYQPAAGAAETGRHVMASPLSLGIDAAQSLARPGFGEREALKLAFAQYGSTVGEQVAPHRTAAMAMPLNFRPIIVPNTLQAGDQYYGETFSVFAVAVGGSIELDGSGKSENDYYVFGGRAGEMFTFELSSRTAGRFAGRQIDGILRLYDSAGNLLAANDDDFESQDAILIDVRLPADGTYYLVVDTFADETDTDTGRYELMAYRMGVGAEVGRGDTLIGSSGSDTLRGSTGPDVIQITSDASANTIETGSRIAVVDITQNPSYDLSKIVGDPIVVGANGEPVFTVAPPTASVDEASFLQLQFTAVDPDSGGVIYDLVNAPPGATIDATTGAFRWLPTDSGTFTFAVRATDIAGVSTTADVTVTVNGVAPTVSLTGVPTTSPEGTALHFGTVVSDVSPADRAAGFTFVWTVTDLINNIVVAAGSGSTLSFTPSDNGQFRVSVAVSDKDGVTTVESADFTASNVAPTVVLSSGDATVAEGSSATFTATATDPSPADAGSLVYVWTVNGSTKLSGFGLSNFSYVPAANGMDTIAVTVFDPDGDFDTGEFSLPVTNAAPSIVSFTVTTPEANRVEGSPLTATVTFTDPGRVGNGGTETYRVTWTVTGTNGQTETFESIADGSGPVAYTFTPSDNGKYDIAVSVTENNADAATAVQTLAGIAVANVAPTVDFAGPTSGLINDSLTFVLTAADAGPLDRAANFTFQIDWNGDGIVDQTLVAPSGTAVSHAFETAGLHTVRVTATDKDGAAGSPVAVVVDVIPAENKLNVLTIYGTNKSDDILVRMTNAGLVWELNKSRFGPLSGIDKIVIFGLNGNDDIRVEGSVTIPAEIHGDAGNDTLRSGAGNDTLSGGTGDDELIATTGNDILYGDAGDDTLRAGTGQDTLYGGEGDDDLRADRGNDMLYGDAGDDTVRGGDGSDSLSGGAGNDDIRGGSGNDVIDGGTGFLDTLDGGDGNDAITDPDGAVDVDGGSDADSIALVFLAPPAGLSLPRATVEGGSGNDAISISSSRSSLRMDLDGGSGDDTFDLSGTWQTIDLEGGSGRDTLRRHGSASAVVLHGIEVDLR